MTTFLNGVPLDTVEERRRRIVYSLEVPEIPRKWVYADPRAPSAVDRDEESWKSQHLRIRTRDATQSEMEAIAGTSARHPMHRLGVESLATCGTSLYSASRDGLVVRWDFDANKGLKYRQSLQAHTHWVNGMVVNDASRGVVTCSSDNTVQLWQPNSPIVEATVAPTIVGHHDDVVKRITTHPRNAASVITSGFDSKIKVWDLGSQRRTAVQTLSMDGSAYALGGTPGLAGSLVGFGANDHVANIWDTRTSGIVKTLRGHSGTVRSLALSQDEKWALTASDDCSVRLWSLANEQCLFTFRHHSNAVRAMYATRAGQGFGGFYSADAAGYVCKVDFEGLDFPGYGDCVLLAKNDLGVSSLELLGSADEKRIALADSSSAVSVYDDIASRTQRIEQSIAPFIDSLELSTRNPFKTETVPDIVPISQVEENVIKHVHPDVLAGIPRGSVFPLLAPSDEAYFTMQFKGGDGGHRAQKDVYEASSRVPSLPGLVLDTSHVVNHGPKKYETTTGPVLRTLSRPTQSDARRASVHDSRRASMYEAKNAAMHEAKDASTKDDAASDMSDAASLASTLLDDKDGVSDGELLVRSESGAFLVLKVSDADPAVETLGVVDPKCVLFFKDSISSEAVEAYDKTPIPFRMDPATPSRQLLRDLSGLVAYETRIAVDAVSSLAQCSPLKKSPLFVVPGTTIGALRHELINDRHHVLTLSTAGSVDLWDIVKLEHVGRFPPQEVDRIVNDEAADLMPQDGTISVANPGTRLSAQSKVLEGIHAAIETYAAAPSWCSLNCFNGSLNVILEKGNAFDAEQYVDDLWTHDNPDATVNFGKLVLKTLCQGFIDKYAQKGSKEETQDDLQEPLLGWPLSLRRKYHVRDCAVTVVDRSVPDAPPADPSALPLAIPPPFVWLHGHDPGALARVSVESANLQQPAPDESANTSTSLVSRLFKNKSNTKTGEASASTGTVASAPLTVHETALPEKAHEIRTTQLVQKAPNVYSTEHVPVKVNDMQPFMSVRVEEFTWSARTWFPTFRSITSLLGDDYAEFLERAPLWVLSFLMQNSVPEKELPKQPFVLAPEPGSGLPEMPSNAVNVKASRVLRMCKVGAFVESKLDLPQGSVQITCKHRPLPPHVTLQTLRTYLWKQSSDMVINYRRV